MANTKNEGPQESIHNEVFPTGPGAPEGTPPLYSISGTVSSPAVRELIEQLQPFDGFDWGEELTNVAGLVVSRPGERPQVILNAAYAGDMTEALSVLLEEYLEADLTDRRGWLSVGGAARPLKPLETLAFERALGADFGTGREVSN